MVSFRRYLNRRHLNKTTDIYEQIVMDLIEELCREVLPDVVRSVASKLVDEYLEYMLLMRRLEMVVTPLVHEIVRAYFYRYCDRYQRGLKLCNSAGILLRKPFWNRIR